MTPAFGIYIHWPFCQSKCPYCDFNSLVAAGIDQEKWRNAYLAELNHYASDTADRAVTSVFFGGGTPSLMDKTTVAAVIDRIAALWPVSPELEITAEANPSSAEVAVFEGFNAAGVNRLSIGAQSFNDRTLSFLGRLHGAEEAKNTLEAASRIFDRVSFDLIYAHPGQSAENWRQELIDSLQFASELNIGHVSLYQLTIEPGTNFHRDRMAPADDEKGGQLFEITQEITEKNGYPAYEISNHAWPGQECRHNLVYWRGEDYIGIGPGAHGRLTTDFITETTLCHRAPEKWLDAVQSTGAACQKRQKLTGEERFEEIVLMGLRLKEGLSQQRFRQLTGQSLFGKFDRDNLQFLEKEGFLEISDDYIRATSTGLQRLNAILDRLLN